MTKPRLFFALFFVAAVAFAQTAATLTVDQVLSFVSSQIKLKGDDKATADYLLKVKLSQRLDGRTVEELQGKGGVGPRTLQALHKLIDDSALLPPPPPKVVVAPPPTIPPPSAAEQASVLAEVKDYALNYTKNLPNYICVQTTKRHIQPTDPKYRAVGDEIQELLGFADGKESYKVQMINGATVNLKKHEELGGVVTSGEFGSMLQGIFDPLLETEFKFERWGTWDGRRMYVYSFKVPKEHGYSMYHGESKREYTSAYEGLVFADAETKAVIRIKMDCVGIPADYPIKEVGLTLEYRTTKISENAYVLPYHFELDSKEVNLVSKNEADYKLYRKFGAESSIIFEEEPAPDQPKK